MMGMRVWVSWLTWFIKYFIFSLISVLIMTLFLHLDVGNGAVLNRTAPSITFTFLMLYAICTIFFCFAISAFFSKGDLKTINTFHRKHSLLMNIIIRFCTLIQVCS